MDTHGFVPDDSLWDAWRPEEIASRLAGVEAPWYVAAGWSIDLFLGRETRTHGDLEIALPANRFGEITAALPDLEFMVVGDGMAWPLDVPGVMDQHHQTWGREPGTGAWRVDVFREPTRGGEWVCRRDERIRLPLDRVIARTTAGIPYARPETTLLFKARADRPKDAADFASVRPFLDEDARRWLADALGIVHPGHAWIAALA